MSKKLEKSLYFHNEILTCSFCGSHYITLSTKKKNGKVYTYFLCSRKMRLGWNTCSSKPILDTPATRKFIEWVKMNKRPC